MQIAETERLKLRWLDVGDAPFILALLNDPAWLQFIGDRGVRTVEAAQAYLRNGPMAMYQRLGFGLYCVALKSAGTPIGICGLIKRDTLPDIDLGFAFLPEFRGRGFALESGVAVLDHGMRQFALSRIVAIVSPENVDSVRLLSKLGFFFERTLCLTPGEAEVQLFALEGQKSSTGAASRAV